MALLDEEGLRRASATAKDACALLTLEKEAFLHVVLDARQRRMCVEALADPQTVLWLLLLLACLVLAVAVLFYNGA